MAVKPKEGISVEPTSGPFVCNNCGCVDLLELAEPDVKGDDWLCSDCKPNGQWHCQFPKELYDPKLDNVINRPGV